MPDRIIHVGFPKTGTTFLQKNIYPNLQGIKYFNYSVSDQLFYEIIFLDDLDFDAEIVRSKLSEKFHADQPTLFSFESLTGAPFIYKGANRSQIPKRLKDLGFNKVIITIREQTKIVDSLYRQYIVQGGVMRFKDFIDIEEKWKLSLRPFYLGYLDYDKLIEAYWKVFGKENVLVLEQEALKEDQNEFVSSILKFIRSGTFETPKKIEFTNDSLSNLSIWLLRICNHFIFTSQKPNNLISNKISSWIFKRLFVLLLDPYFFRFVSKKKSFFDKKTKSEIRDRFKESNAKLADMLEGELSPDYYRD